MHASHSAFDGGAPILIVGIARSQGGVKLPTGGNGKQFLEPASASQIQLGLQLRDHATTERLLTGNAMCSHRVNVTSVAEVDDELLGFLREAYDRN